MASIGKYSTLTVLRETASGYFLDGGELGDILIPGNLAPKGLSPGETIEVFVYLDSEDRLVATTEKPRATVGQFAGLKVVSVHPTHGAFLDWGLSKDLLLPFREQGDHQVREGQRVVVYIKVDERSRRIIATTRFNRYLSKAPPPFPAGEAVRFLVTHRTPLGFSAIVENRYSGLIFHSDLAHPLQVGQAIDGYVRTLRFDGKIDLSLDPTGTDRVDNLGEQILTALDTAGGRLPFDDKSSSESIREAFNASKKSFKKAIGSLYKERKIRFSDQGGIERVPTGDRGRAD